MTVAVCVYCGSIKHGAFTLCRSCGACPESEIDVTYSLALTDHYFPIATLEEISKNMQQGHPRPSLSEDQEKIFREAARTYIEKFGAAFRSKNISQEKSERIRIHPRGKGRTTDATQVKVLIDRTPKSFRKAQDLLVATQRYRKGPGLFRSEKKLIQNLQTEIYALDKVLRKEGYGCSKPEKLLFSYLSEFSDAFPNWQQEYEELATFIPRCF